MVDNTIKVQVQDNVRAARSGRGGDKGKSGQRASPYAESYENAPDWARKSKRLTTPRPSGSLSTSRGFDHPMRGPPP